MNKEGSTLLIHEPRFILLTLQLNPIQLLDFQ